MALRYVLQRNEGFFFLCNAFLYIYICECSSQIVHVSTSLTGQLFDPLHLIDKKTCLKPKQLTTIDYFKQFIFSISSFTNNSSQRNCQIFVELAAIIKRTIYPQAHLKLLQPWQLVVFL